MEYRAGGIISELKKALMSVPVLARPNFSLPFTLQTDASDFALGILLSQEHEDGEHPVVYASRVLTQERK